MRNPERIEPFLKKLGQIWQHGSDLRFGQLLECIKVHGELPTNVFNVEDDDWEKALDIILKRIDAEKMGQL